MVAKRNRSSTLVDSLQKRGRSTTMEEVMMQVQHALTTLQHRVQSFEDEMSTTINMLDRIARLEHDARVALEYMRQLPQRAEVGLVTAALDDWAGRATTTGSSVEIHKSKSLTSFL